MTKKAPERIWAGPVAQNQIDYHEWEDGDWDVSGETITYAEHATEYIRADVAEAMIVAEREACAKVAESFDAPGGKIVAMQTIAAAIREGTE